MASLAEIRARLQASADQTGNNKSFSGDNTVYPHWNIEENAQTVLRFLPDGNPDNTFFWVERQVIKLPFAGIKGDPNSKPCIVQVPCVEMWGDKCPVLAEVRTWFKDTALEDMGRKYWKKRSYIFQGFVREDPMNEEAPENPIRRFIMGPQLYAPIKDALMDPELVELPTDALQGLDFTVKKTSKGGYADYSTSKWARRESALTEAEQAAIDEHGLFDLNDFLPKRPSATELEMIVQLFEDSVDGKPYDSAKYAAYYRPPGVQAPAKDAGHTPGPNPEEAAAAPAAAAPAAPAAAPVETAEELPFEPDAPKEAAPAAAEESADSGNRAADILAQIRSRQSNS